MASAAELKAVIDRVKAVIAQEQNYLAQELHDLTDLQGLTTAGVNLQQQMAALPQKRKGFFSGLRQAIISTPEDQETKRLQAELEQTRGWCRAKLVATDQMCAAVIAIEQNVTQELVKMTEILPNEPGIMMDLEFWRTKLPGQSKFITTKLGELKSLFEQRSLDWNKANQSAIDVYQQATTLNSTLVSFINERLEAAYRNRQNIETFYQVLQQASETNADLLIVSPRESFGAVELRKGICIVNHHESWFAINGIIDPSLGYGAFCVPMADYVKFCVDNEAAFAIQPPEDLARELHMPASTHDLLTPENSMEIANGDFRQWMEKHYLGLTSNANKGRYWQGRTAGSDDACFRHYIEFVRQEDYDRVSQMYDPLTRRLLIPVKDGKELLSILTNPNKRRPLVDQWRAIQR